MDERHDYQLMKSRLHRKILDRLNHENLRKISRDSAARDEVLVLIRSAISAEVVPLSFAERERLAREIVDERFSPPTRAEMRQKRKFGLTPRELEIVSSVVAGYSNREIAEYFKISENTVELVLRAFGRLGGPDDADAAGIAVKKPRNPHLNSGSAAANPDEPFGSAL